MELGLADVVGASTVCSASVEFVAWGARFAVVGDFADAARFAVVGVFTVVVRFAAGLAVTPGFTAGFAVVARFTTDLAVVAGSAEISSAGAEAAGDLPGALATAGVLGFAFGLVSVIE